MTAMTHVNPTIQQAINLKNLNIEPHWCHPHSKRPIGKDWINKEAQPIDTIISSYQHDANIGILLGKYSKPTPTTQLVIVDLDIKSTDLKDRDEAYDTIKRYLGGDLSIYPTVHSGRGGGSAHFWIQVPLIHLLAHNKIGILKSSKQTTYIQDGKQKHAACWSVDILVKGNVIVPPSIHPDTRRSYSWSNEPSDISNIPVIPDALLRLIENGTCPSTNSPPQEPLTLEQVNVNNLGLSPETVRLIVDGEGSENFPSRSEALYHVTHEMIHAGVPDNHIASVLTDAANVLSAKALDNRPTVESAAQWLRTYVINKIRNQVEYVESGEVFNDNWNASYQRKEEKRQEEKANRPFLTIQASTFHGTTPKPMAWTVDGLFPKGYSGLLSAGGGKGKSLETLHLAACIALGHPYRTRPVIQGKAIAMYCEDDMDEIQRRLGRVLTIINKERFDMGENPFELADLTDLHIYSGVGRSNVLMSFDKTVGRTTELFGQLVGELDRLVEQAEELSWLDDPKTIELVVIDTLADTFAGNENDRSQVRQFVSTVMNHTARHFNCFTLACGHVAKNTETYSGSTAWLNSVRIALALEEEEGKEYISLVTKKSNYSKPDQINLLFNQQVGAFEYLDPVATVAHQAQVIGQLHGRALRAIHEARAKGYRLIRRNGTENSATRVLADKLGVDMAIAEKCWKELEDGGWLVYREVDRHSKACSLELTDTGVKRLGDELPG